MQIVRLSNETMSVSERYMLTMSPEIMKMSDVESQVIGLKNWAMYVDTDSDGTEREILSVMTPEGEVYATNSPTFKQAFFNMVSLFEIAGESVDKIKIIGGTSKAGRHFITCTLAM